ncbi:hypothetical protein NQ318_010885 [Aromia moschata]|uniref:Uncharacterized protein n=1 Tax=Aromia moschata TaxID=1265417 RepID=A0AAV8XKB3_9CUCU|nr:hypothetical protein NQ318_010885 [Aromia moschata]
MIISFCVIDSLYSEENVEYPTPAVDPDPKALADQKPGTLPSDVDVDVPSKDLLMRLLEIQPSRRLRSVRTLETIAFYKGFNFKDVMEKKIQPNDLIRTYFPNGPPNDHIEEDELVTMPGSRKIILKHVMSGICSKMNRTKQLPSDVMETPLNRCLNTF